MEKDQKKLKDSKRSLLTSVIFIIALVSLITTGYLLPKYQKEYRGFGKVLTSGQPLELIERELRNRDKVLVVGNKKLLDLNIVGTKFFYEDEFKEIKEALLGNDEERLVSLLKRYGINYILVSTDFTNRGLLPKVNLRNRFSLYEPFEKFHAIVLTAPCGLYEIKEQFKVTDNAGKELVRLARAIFEGEEVDPSQFSEEVRKKHKDKVMVSVAILGLKPIPKPKDKYSKFVRRDYYTLKSGSSLYEATYNAAKRLKELWEPKGLQEIEGPIEEAIKRLWVEVEVLYDWTKVENRKGKLTPFEYSDFLWRAIELGIHGIAADKKEGKDFTYFLPSSAIYWSRKTVEEFLSRLSEKLGIGKEGYITEKLNLEIFRTHHFRELEVKGPIVRLRRGFPPIGEEVINKETFVTAIKWASRWLVDNLQPDGTFEYKYFPSRDIYLREIFPEDEKYNEVRHALCVYSLFMIMEFFPEDKKLEEAAFSSLLFLLKNTVFGPKWFDDVEARKRLPQWVTQKPFGPPIQDKERDDLVGPSQYWESFDGYRRKIPQNIAYVRWNDNVKMGAVAGTVLAISEMLHRYPEKFEEYKPFLEAFGEMILFMQKKDGSFNMYFVPPGHSYYSVENTIYPGEILFAISRLYEHLNDKRFLEAFIKAHKYYQKWFREEVKKKEPDGTYEEKRRVDLVQFVPWISMANNDLCRVLILKGERNHPMFEDIARFGIEVSDWIIDTYQYTDDRAFYPEYLGGYYKIPTELPAMHGCVYTEGTAAAFNLALILGDEEKIKKMRRSTQIGCRFAIQQLFISDMSSAPLLLKNDQFLPSDIARDKSRGGARYALNLTKLRIDYTYHTISAIAQAVRYFRNIDWKTK